MKTIKPIECWDQLVLVVVVIGVMVMVSLVLLLPAHVSVQQATAMKQHNKLKAYLFQMEHQTLVAAVEEA